MLRQLTSNVPTSNNIQITSKVQFYRQKMPKYLFFIKHQKQCIHLLLIFAYHFTYNLKAITHTLHSLD